MQLAVKYGGVRSNKERYKTMGQGRRQEECAGGTHAGFYILNFCNTGTQISRIPTNANPS